LRDALLLIFVAEVRELVVLDMLVEITGQRRNRHFQYAPYVQLFDEQGR
jgi:hypothetical protein